MTHVAGVLDVAATWPATSVHVARAPFLRKARRATSASHVTDGAIASHVRQKNTHAHITRKDHRMTRKRKASSAAKAPPSAIVGSFFHTFDSDQAIQFQGHVLESLAAGVYFVEFFSWLDGRPTTRSVVRLDAMETWQFYADGDEMRLADKRRRAGDDATRESEDEVQ